MMSKACSKRNLRQFLFRKTELKREFFSCCIGLNPRNRTSAPDQGRGIWEIILSCRIHVLSIREDCKVRKSGLYSGWLSRQILMKTDFNGQTSRLK